MARGGFLSRIRDAIRNVVAPRPPERAPPGQPEPPREREPRGDPYRNIWRDQHVKRGKGNYRKNLNVFHRLVDPVESDPDEQLELWESYVRHIVKDEGGHRRNSTSNMFWRDSGIDPQDMDWARWREAMGYTGKRRSRTP